jgi:hypothetical protein
MWRSGSHDRGSTVGSHCQADSPLPTLLARRPEVPVSSTALGREAKKLTTICSKLQSDLPFSEEVVMGSNVRYLVEQICLAISILGPGLLLAKGTNDGSTFFVVIVIQYALGAVGGLLLYTFRAPRALDDSSNRNSGSSGGRSVSLKRAA